MSDDAFDIIQDPSHLPVEYSREDSNDFSPVSSSGSSVPPTASAIPTFTTKLGSPSSDRVIVGARIFVDCGAQSTFVHPDVVEQLDLHPIGVFVGAIDSFNLTEPPKGT